MQEKPYYLGLDMGTNSVGWAVTDQHYNLLKAKGKDLWGIREFIEADTSVERRTHRISRRRRQREQARIGLLNDYFHDAIIAIDPSFFQRLENSKYHLEDKDQNVRYKYNIFNDPDYTDADYYTQYPSIYHLRKELLENPKPHDVRLVYLALLNMFKHRGHFLNSGISDGNNERSLKDAYINFAISVSELTEDYFNQDVDYSTIEGILSSRDLNRTKKAEELSTVLGIDFKNKKYKEYLRAICGLKINAYTLFSDQLPDDTTKIDLCVSDASFDEKSEELVSLIGEDLFQIILNIKEIYDIGSLAGILKGYTYLSQARVAAYDKHKHDLKLLKSSIKKYCTKEEYNNFFNSDADGSYASYIGSFNSGNKERRVGSKRTSEDLYKEIKKLLKGANKSDPAINEIFTSIETESFLPKQLTASNGIIPNQVHSKEMARILTNAENYLPFLKETDENNLSISNRILQLYKFQIPYYIGPVTEKSQRDGGNGWVIRKDNGRVFPWNIEEKIDVKATSEAFISRMVRRCTYMNGKQVLPKASLEYESFRVLNEINNLRIDGERIPVTLKQDIYTDLFQKGKKVTKKQLCNYLATRGLIESSEQVTGIDIAINNSLSTYGKFKAIYGGFTSVTGAYFFLVEHDEKKKRIRTIESVPLYLADKIDKDSSELERYCDKLGLVNYDVRVRKIKIGSLIKYNGYFCYITGKTGYRLIVRNATNLCLTSNWRKYIKKIEKYKETTIIDNVITAEENIKLYNELLNKFTVGIFGRRPNPIGEKMDSARDKFASLSIENQCLALYQILQLTAILGNESDLQLIGASTHAGKMLISKKIGTDEIYLINQSPTGLFETKIDLQTI